MRISTVCLGPLQTNCYLLEVAGTAILVDPAEDGDALRKFVGDRRIDSVVLTHGHFDHVGGAWAVEAGERLIHPADVPYVEYYYPDQEPLSATLEESQELLPGLRVLHLPGHSPGSIALCIEDLLVVGDVLFAGSIGRTDLAGGSETAMEDSLRRLTALQGNYRVFPGHGDPTTMEQERLLNPFLRGMR